MQFAELQNLIKSRRSVRRYQEKKVPEELLTQAIELATWAPNAGNQQNWHFYIIENEDTIRAIADTVQASVDQIVSWPEAAEFGDTATNWQQNASFFRSAPAAIAVTTTKYQSVADKILAVREKIDTSAARMRQERNMAGSHIQSAGGTIAYLLLILHQMGLGACWMTGPIQVKGEVEKIIGIPPEKDCVAFIPVGYPAEEPPPKGRHPVKEVCKVIR